MAYLLPSRSRMRECRAYGSVCSSARTSLIDADGHVAWVSSDETVISVAVYPNDSALCTISSMGPAGTAQVTATMDADFGACARQVITLSDITVVAGEAVASTITIQGDPQPIPIP